jgi:hypothetical protein
MITNSGAARSDLGRGERDTSKIKPRPQGTPSDHHETARLLKAKFERRKAAIEQLEMRVRQHGQASQEEVEALMQLGLKQDEIDAIIARVLNG